ncbi:hypothetical protein ZEAMMB73_Zm00001d025349 [Zea mays]|uniref:Uncharacterized protein n=1 Tax=Zea mays TaxID=4577 RepID=A0A1D6J6M1_MAIZE|nr:hypothetical protein ZEAMMB73_Zm00001d025349 [Zea mays]
MSPRSFQDNMTCSTSQTDLCHYSSSARHDSRNNKVTSSRNGGRFLASRHRKISPSDFFISGSAQSENWNCRVVGFSDVSCTTLSYLPIDIAHFNLLPYLVLLSIPVLFPCLKLMVFILLVVTKVKTGWRSLLCRCLIWSRLRVLNFFSKCCLHAHRGGVVTEEIVAKASLVGSAPISRYEAFKL